MAVDQDLAVIRTPDRKARLTVMMRRTARHPAIADLATVKGLRDALSGHNGVPDARHLIARPSHSLARRFARRSEPRLCPSVQVLRCVERPVSENGVFGAAARGGEFLEGILGDQQPAV